MNEVRESLEGPEGYTVVEWRGHTKLGVEDARTELWNLGCAIGDPVKQGVDGTVIYDVVDKGASLSAGARFSVTNKETGLHTDRSFERVTPRYVLLYCVESAAEGGTNLMVDGRVVIRHLAEATPEALDRLQDDFWFDRRGGTRPGEQRVARYPVIALRPTDAARGGLSDSTGPVIRYMRHYIETGYEVAGEVIDASTRQALDAFDAACATAPSVELRLHSGGLLIVNNHYILHGRTAFRDDVATRRHLLRMWVEPERAS